MTKSRFHISVSERKLFLRVFDMFWVFIALFFAQILFSEYAYFNFNSEFITIWSITLIIYLQFFGDVFELYVLRTASDSYLSLRSIFLTVLFSGVFYMFTPIISPVLPENRLQLLVFLGMLSLGYAVNRAIYIGFIFSPLFRRNTLVIGPTAKVKEVIDYYNTSTTMTVSAYVAEDAIDGAESSFQTFDSCNIQELLEQNYITEILVSFDGLEKYMSFINKQLTPLFETGVSIKTIDSYLESVREFVSEDQLNHNLYQSFTLSKSHENNLYLAFKRVFDIFLGLLGIGFMLLLIPFVVIGNLIGNRGKLFYTQKRVGKKGRLFTIVKFRTMVAAAEEKKEVWASKNDARITPFGRLLRKTRLDEVPQFINVLLGSMSVIGPRPERPGFVKQLSTTIPYYGIRHIVKPGLTGWAQVKHPYASSVEDQHQKLLFDLYYIKKRNLLLEFKIIMRTMSTVVFMRGT